MQQYILFNDQFQPKDAPLLSAGNRAFKYGDGIFETMRMMSGKLQYVAYHADRIKSSMKSLKMEGYNLLDEYFLKQKTAQLIKKNALKGNVRFRLSIYREGEGLYTPQSNKVGYLLEAEPLEDNTYAWNSKGLLVDVFEDVTKPINKLSACKTVNALPFVMASIFRKQHRLDEVLLLNQNGFLCEGISTNIFVVYQNTVYTPALSEGCVAGVMRRVMMQLAKKHNFPLVEAQINPKILLEADEVFLTNAVSGLRWVMGYGKRRYFNQVSKKFSLWLNQSLKEEL